MPGHVELKKFSRLCEEHFAEAEMFLLPDREFLPAQQLESSARRVEYIRLKADALGLDVFSAICKGLADVLHSSGRMDSNAAIAAREVFDCLRFYLSIEQMRLEGRKAPEDYESFAASSSELLLRRARGEQEGTGGLRILLADDEEVVRSFLDELLIDEGNIVLAVKNGEEAIAALDTGFFELMYTDINMPFASGLDVLRHATTAGLDTAIVIITGYASVENAAEAIRYGAYDYITKPFRDSESLLAIVERAREHITLKRKNRQLVRDMQNKNRELQRYAEGLEDALKNLEEKNRALIHADRMATLGVLVAGLAHEINNPTTFIRGNLQTLEKFWAILEEPLKVAAQVSPAQKKLEFVLAETPVLLRDMMVGTDRITRITNGLRSFARSDAADDVGVMSPEECIDHALNLTGNRLRNCVEVIRNTSNLPKVQCSEQQITQVLVNLLVNAADAVENHTHPKIWIEGQPVENGVLVRVADNGVGIPSNIREKIFDPFFTTKPVDRGTGLGLSISLGIVRSHGGMLTVRCPEGVEWGTVFEMFLPSHIQPVKKQELPRVLIADTLSSTFRAVESGLRSTGMYIVDSVMSGEELFDQLDSFAPAVLVVDTNLPDMDGFEVLKRLGDIRGHEDMATVMVTDMSGPDVRGRMRGLGANQVFVKPCKINDLIDCVAALSLQEQQGRS